MYFTEGCTAFNRLRLKFPAKLFAAGDIEK
jgi:hypothetical protein